jgi:hypothetical protein
MGQREFSIAQCRKKIGEHFLLMERHPSFLSEYWVSIMESVTGLEDFNCPISKDDLRMRLLQVCDKHVAFQPIRSRTIFEPLFADKPETLVTIMKEFASQLPADDEEEHTASSTMNTFQAVQRTNASRSQHPNTFQAGQRTHESRSQHPKQMHKKQNDYHSQRQSKSRQSGKVRCHSCASYVERSDLQNHRQQCTCKPCDICNRPHLTRMHDTVISYYNEQQRLNETRTQTRPARSVSFAPESTASVAQRQGSSTDFFSEETPSPFYAFAALERAPEPQCIETTSQKVKRRLIRVSIGFLFIYCLVASKGSLCNKIFKKKICKGTSAAATAMLLYSAINLQPNNPPVLGMTVEDFQFSPLTETDWFVMDKIVKPFVPDKLEFKIDPYLFTELEDRVRLASEDEIDNSDASSDIPSLQSGSYQDPSDEDNDYGKYADKSHLTNDESEDGESSCKSQDESSNEDDDTYQYMDDSYKNNREGTTSTEKHMDNLEVYSAGAFVGKFSNVDVSGSNIRSAMATSLIDQTQTKGFALLDTACWNHLSGERKYFTN